MLFLRNMEASKPLKCNVLIWLYKGADYHKLCKQVCLWHFKCYYFPGYCYTSFRHSERLKRIGKHLHDCEKKKNKQPPYTHTCTDSHGERKGDREKKRVGETHTWHHANAQERNHALTHACTCTHTHTFTQYKINKILLILFTWKYSLTTKQYYKINNDYNKNRHVQTRDGHTRAILSRLRTTNWDNVGYTVVIVSIMRRVPFTMHL